MNPRALVIEYVPIDSLRPDPSNPRLHNKKQIQQIARSIQLFELNLPFLVDAFLQLIAGHARLLACKRLGIKHVPVIRLEHLSAHQKQAFMIADNKLTENAEWDERLLSEHLKILSEAELDFSLEVTGFEMSEIDMMIEGLTPAHPGKDDPADIIPELETDLRITVAGDVWILDKHRVCCGDARSDLTYATLMKARRAAMVFTDPPV